MYWEKEHEVEETVCRVHFCYSRRIMTMITETGRERLVRVKNTIEKKVMSFIKYMFCFIKGTQG